MSSVKFILLPCMWMTLMADIKGIVINPDCYRPTLLVSPIPKVPLLNCRLRISEWVIDERTSALVPQGTSYQESDHANRCQNQYNTSILAIAPHPFCPFIPLGVLWQRGVRHSGGRGGQHLLHHRTGKGNTLLHLTCTRKNKNSENGYIKINMLNHF